MKVIFYALLIFLSLDVQAQLLDSIAINIDGGIVLSDYTINRRGTAGYNYGFSLEFPYKGFALTTGVGISNYGSHFNFVSRGGNSGVIDDPKGFQVTAFDFHYLSFPVRLKYTYRFVYVQAGVKPEIFMYQLPKDMGILYEDAYENKPYHSPNSVRKRNISMDGALGFIYYPKKTLPFRLYLEAGASYFLKPIYEDSRTEQAQVSFLLKTGVRWVISRR